MSSNLFQLGGEWFLATCCARWFKVSEIAHISVPEDLDDPQGYIHLKGHAEPFQLNRDEAVSVGNLLFNARMGQEGAIAGPVNTSME